MYARLAGVSTDVLIDDEVDLPARLPVSTERSRVERIVPLKRQKR
jgi:hypothetical protein